MTEEELQQRALEFATTGYEKKLLSKDAILIIKAARFDGYIAGAKENGIVWHDLRKDPNDLPTQANTGISDYVITDRGVGYYNGRVKSWWVTNDYALTDKVIAWCETPKFEGE